MIKTFLITFLFLAHDTVIFLEWLTLFIKTQIAKHFLVLQSPLPTIWNRKLSYSHPRSAKISHPQRAVIISHARITRSIVTSTNALFAVPSNCARIICLCTKRRWRHIYTSSEICTHMCVNFNIILVVPSSWDCVWTTVMHPPRVVLSKDRSVALFRVRRVVGHS